MAEASLQVRWTELNSAVLRHLGNTRTATGDAATDAQEIIDRGLRQFYTPPILPGESAPHEWSFMKPRATLRVFARITGALATVPAFVSPTTTVTAASAADDFFTDGRLIGNEITFLTSGNSYQITGETSATVLKLGSIGASEEQDASGEIAGSGTSTAATYSAPSTTITSTDGDTPFTSSMVGQYISFGAGNEFIITSVTSTTVCVVTGDASAFGSNAFSITDRFEIMAGDYSLPDNFGGIEGDLTFGSRTLYPPVRMTSEMRIRQLRSDSGHTETGRPKFAAVRPRFATPQTAGAGSGDTAGQRWELMLWPIPDGNYTLHYTGLIQPNAIDTTNEFPMGGALHGETIMASCIAVAETYKAKPNPDRLQQFMSRLAASVGLDRRASSAERLGYNGDTSDRRYRGYSRFDDMDDVTYNNVTYQSG